ncbi:MAG TPA: carboxypeptidase-like regulatory domain-containing protein [Candidatus Acidoferrales bacterium]
MNLHRRTIVSVLATIFVLGIALTGSPQDKQEKKKEAQLRTVHGSVLDSHQNPVADSIVYLKNLRTQDVKTHIADGSGVYRFSGLDPNMDYEIHAEHDDLSSATHSISSFDSRKDIEVVLKLDKKRAG